MPASILESQWGGRNSAYAAANGEEETAWACLAEAFSRRGAWDHGACYGEEEEGGASLPSLGSYPSQHSPSRRRLIVRIMATGHIMADL